MRCSPLLLVPLIFYYAKAYSSAASPQARSLNATVLVAGLRTRSSPSPLSDVRLTPLPPESFTPITAFVPPVRSCPRLLRRSRDPKCPADGATKVSEIKKAREGRALFYTLPDPSSTACLKTAMQTLEPQPEISDVTELSAGFCNWVYLFHSSPNLVAKVFSNLAKLRLDAPYRSLVDKIASRHNIGPEVIYADENCIVSSYVPGSELKEADVHGTGAFGGGGEVCEVVASVVAALHTVDLESEPAVRDVRERVGAEKFRLPNMLWGTLNRMAGYVLAAEADCISPALLEKGWTASRVVAEIAEMHALITPLGLPVVVGHGDLKPSNVMVLRDSECDAEGDNVCEHVSLIDFELSGPNFRGFDLFKLFRTSNPTSRTQENFERFCRRYLECTTGEKVDDKDVASLIAEAKLFEPLTWLEAGTFFLFAVREDSAQRERWNGLASDRLENYERAKKGLQDRVDEYKKLNAMT